MPEATIVLIFTTSFVVALSGAMMPGPLLAITISETMRRGFWAGPKLMVGHGILGMALIAALTAGLSEFVKSNLVSIIIGLVGGIILMAMGVMTAKQGWGKTTMPTADPRVSGRSRMVVLSGILGSISNPYWFIWWITLGTIYLLWSLKAGIAGVATFFSGHILADLAWYTLVAFIIATGRKVMNDTVYRGLLLVCGLGLIVLGGYFIMSAARFLVG